ncbi:MAG: ArnT family glycosyltransferase [Fimbriimonadaceae bacterium]
MNNLLRKYWYVLCVLPYLGFWTYGLTDLDEGFYGAVTMDMLRLHDWVTPTLNGVPWFEKPILAYWLSMPFVSLIPNEFGARLPSFLCTVATIWIIYRFVKKQLNEETAIASALIYSTSLLVVAIGRMMMTDAPLVLCLTVAFTTFFESIRGNQKLRFLTAASLGFAVLAKGPVALILFGLIGIFAFWRLPETRPNWIRYWLTGTLLLVAIIATWYVPCYLANGQSFIDKFLIEQNIGRFKGGDTAHTVPIWANPIFYPAVLLISTLPWIAGAIKSKFWQTTNTDQSKNPLLTYLLIWFLVVLGFFTISGTKLVHYILPAIPPLSILIANALLARHPRFSNPLSNPAIKSDKSGQQSFPPQGVGSVVADGNREGLTKIITRTAITSITTLAIAQYAFYTDWSNRFKDVQSFAIEAREKDLKLYDYNLGRDPGVGSNIKTTLDDTSHPSLGFYYRKPILESQNNGEPNSIFIGKKDSFLNAVVASSTDQISTFVDRGKYTARINEPKN